MCLASNPGQPTTDRVDQSCPTGRPLAACGLEGVNVSLPELPSGCHSPPSLQLQQQPGSSDSSPSSSFCFILSSQRVGQHCTAHSAEGAYVAGEPTTRKAQSRGQGTLMVLVQQGVQMQHVAQQAMGNVVCGHCWCSLHSMQAQTLRNRQP